MSVTATSAKARAYLVESIPSGMDELRNVPAGVAYTEDVLLRLVARARQAIDVAAMYWSLLPDPTKPDELDLSEAQYAMLGAEHGRQLHQALVEAASRGVRIRIVQSPGFGDGPQESDLLAEQFPDRVSVHRVNMRDWYGAGIMHQKVWVFDERHVYLGSANMDWRSLSQVKELGLVVENHPALAADVGCMLAAWRCLATLPAGQVATVFDPAVQIERQVPGWSELLPTGRRATSPLANPEFTTRHNLAHPLPLNVNGRAGSVFVTGSPAELCGPGRTFDLDGLLATIREAQESVCVSVMTFNPLAHYYGATGVDASDEDESPPRPVWWPVISDALLQAALTRGLNVRLLVSRWEHTSPLTLANLAALQRIALAAGADERSLGGRLEIKLFGVPGWDRTAGEEQLYPGHSRVNHPKFIVSERRLNVGTSNLTWDYFANSAGSSLNTDHPDLVRQAQRLFDRDWESRYAHPLLE